MRCIIILTDTTELKKFLGINAGDASEDATLSLYVEMASGWIEELLDRKLAFKSRTEYYGGTGSQKLLLRSRPVYTSPTIQVFVDEGGYYGAPSGSFNASTTDLTYGDDFVLKLDQDDGTSRSGILIRINDYWPKPFVRERGKLSPFLGESFGNIKVIYSAGYYVDNLPAPLRLATNMLVARLRYLFPLGMELNSESYEERSISVATNEKDYMLSLVRPIVMLYKNWTF